VSSSVAEPRRGNSGVIHGLLDELAASYAGPAFHDEIAAAREEYFTRSGKVFEDDAEVYEARTLAFLEWYVIERPLASGRTPVLTTMEASDLTQTSPERSAALAAIATSHRSLFDIAHVDAKGVELEDILGGGRFRVIERRSTIGFEVGAIVEARLVWDGEQTVFTKTFLFHPRDARTEVLDMVDHALAAGTANDEIMFRMAQLCLRWHRHGHSNAVRIYKGLGTQGPVPL
jgi:hypothetical protein